MRPSYRITCALFGLFLFCAALCAAPNAAAKRDRKVESGIEAQLARTHPEWVADFRAATEALDAGRYEQGAELYAKVCQAVPDFDAAHRRLGACLGQLGRRAESVAEVEKAYALGESVDNAISLASTLAFPLKAKASEAELERAFKVIREARGKPGGEDPILLKVMAQIALQRARYDVFSAALESLRKVEPDAMETHYFNAIEAARAERWLDSEDEIKLAQANGLDPAIAQRFLDSGIRANAQPWHWAYWTGVTIVVWLLGLAGLLGSGYFLSRQTLRHAEDSDVTQAASQGERRLRRIYRQVINLAGVYYYISLPVVLVMVLGAVAALVFGFLMAGWIPIKLLAILVIGACITIYAMIRSLFVRVKQEDPGRALLREEAPGLWQLTEEVAAAVGTRAIDEIRITPGTDLAVYERGSWRQKMNNEADRILILGTAVLEDFRTDHFRSVLAHEYGHFSNRDTAGGDVALRVQRDMFNFYVAMYEAGQATMFNLAFHFLRLYNFIFRRISHGATRLQEILADRVAAQCYGAGAFEGGLRHVIRRSIEFDRHVDKQVNLAIKNQCRIANLYGRADVDSEALEKDFETVLGRPTTQDDTHPGPRDRFRLIAPLQVARCEPVDGLVWDLFKDREALIAEMMLQVEGNVARHRFQSDQTVRQLASNQGGALVPASSSPQPAQPSHTAQPGAITPPELPAASRTGQAEGFEKGL